MIITKAPSELEREGVVPWSRRVKEYHALTPIDEHAKRGCNDCAARVAQLGYYDSGRSGVKRKGTRK